MVQKMRLWRKTGQRHAVRVLPCPTVCHTNTLQEESMNYKFVKRRRRVKKKIEAPGLPMAMLPYVQKTLLADPGRFAGNPREFAWRELKRAAEDRKRREARA